MRCARGASDEELLRADARRVAAAAPTATASCAHGCAHSTHDGAQGRNVLHRWLMATAAQLTHLDAAQSPDHGRRRRQGRHAARGAVAEARVRLPPAVARALQAQRPSHEEGPGVRHRHRRRRHGRQDAPTSSSRSAIRCALERLHGRHRGSPSAVAHPHSSASVAVHHKTGVEMEALTGASVAALTVYDMCKALSHDIEIGRVRLLAKTGGKRDFRRARRLSRDAAPVTTRARRCTAWCSPAAAARACSATRRRSTTARPHAARARDGAARAARAQRAFVSVRADQRGDPLRARFAQIVDRPATLGPDRRHPRRAGTRIPKPPGWCSPATCPCSMRATLEHLLRARDPRRAATAYRSSHDGLPEPLCAIWEPRTRAATRRVRRRRAATARANS